MSWNRKHCLCLLDSSTKRKLCNDASYIALNSNISKISLTWTKSSEKEKISNFSGFIQNSGRLSLSQHLHKIALVKVHLKTGRAQKGRRNWQGQYLEQEASILDLFSSNSFLSKIPRCCAPVQQMSSGTHNNAGLKYCVKTTLKQNKERPIRTLRGHRSGIKRCVKITTPIKKQPSDPSSFLGFQSYPMKESLSKRSDRQSGALLLTSSQFLNCEEKHSTKCLFGWKMVTIYKAKCKEQENWRGRLETPETFCTL